MRPPLSLQSKSRASGQFLFGHRRCGRLPGARLEDRHPLWRGTQS